MEKVKSSIENLEIEAEKSLETARSQANEILVKANEESQKIINSEIDLTEVKAECMKIIEKAEKESDKTIKEARQQAEKVKSAAEQKIDKTVDRMLNMVTGAKPR